MARPPTGDRDAAPWVVPVHDPVEQLRALADLLARGLLTIEEFEVQKRKALGP